MSNYKSTLQSNNESISSNNIDLQSLIDQANALPEAGTDLPELSNEGSASDLLFGKQLIDSDGNKVTGTIQDFDGSYECSSDSTGGSSSGNEKEWILLTSLPTTYGYGDGDVITYTTYYMEIPINTKSIYFGKGSSTDNLTPYFISYRRQNAWDGQVLDAANYVITVSDVDDGIVSIKVQSGHANDVWMLLI